MALHTVLPCPVCSVYLKRECNDWYIVFCVVYLFFYYYSKNTWGRLFKKKRGLLEAEGETTLRNLKQGPWLHHVSENKVLKFLLWLLIKLPRSFHDIDLTDHLPKALLLNEIHRALLYYLTMEMQFLQGCDRVGMVRRCESWRLIYTVVLFVI